MFRAKFGKIRGNHRIVGHWGMGGSIPFNEEPWKTAFAGYNQKEISELWGKYVNQLTDKALEVLGKDMPRAQARAIVSLIYDVHLIGDRTAGNTIVDPVLHIKRVQEDILKCLRIIYKSRPEVVEAVEKAFSEIHKNCPHAVRAQKILAILGETPLGKHFHEIYVRFFPKDASGNPLIRYSEEMAKKALAAARRKSAYLSKMWGELIKAGRSNKAVQMAAGKVVGAKMIMTGVLQKVVTKKGNEFIVLSVPIPKELAAGGKAGVATFILAEGITYCRYANGNMTEDKFIEETAKNCIDGMVAGTVAYVVVAVGIVPGGWIVVGIGIGAAIAADVTFDLVVDATTMPAISINDLLGSLPTDLQRRPDVWEYSDGSPVFAPMGPTPFAPEEYKRKTPFDPETLGRRPGNVF